MIRLAFTLMVASSLPLIAEDIPTLDAKIHTVTVYRDRAEVVRRFTTTFEAGDYSLLFDNLPGRMEFSSIHVKGKGNFELVDLRTARIQTKEIADEKINKLNAQLTELREKTADLDLADKRIAQRKEALEKVLVRLTSAGKESANPEMDPSKWAAYFEYHVDTLAKLDKEIITNDLSRRSYIKDIDRTQRELSELNANLFKFRNIARVRIDVKQAGPIKIDLAYIVLGPNWSPLYDIRADTKSKKVEVNYFAEIRQSTGENWNGVFLQLSTAQPNLVGREPQMTPWFIRRVVPIITPITASDPLGRDPGIGARREKSFGIGAGSGSARSRQVYDSKNTVTVDMLQDGNKAKTSNYFDYAEVSSGGTAATFLIPRKYDIASNNKPTKVAVTSRSFECEFRHTCVPKLSPHVYLKAKAINSSEFPFIPGPTAVFFDSAFVANASLDYVPSGQEFWTYLGADQSVKVELKELGKVEELTGVFGKKTARTVTQKLFKITNAKTTEIKLSIKDQVPASNHEDIKVIFEDPPYKKDTDGFKVDQSKFVEWHLELKPSAKLDVPFRFAIERPEGFPMIQQ